MGEVIAFRRREPEDTLSSPELFERRHGFLPDALNWPASWGCRDMYLALRNLNRRYEAAALDPLNRRYEELCAQAGYDPFDKEPA